jgi:hypothetical protein
MVERLFEPRTEPALGFPCALDDVLVELVHGMVDFLTGAVELLLGLALGLLVLLPGLDAVLVELLLSLLCLGAGLVGLVRSAIAQRVIFYKTYILLRGGAHCLVALLAGLLELLVLAGEVALDTPQCLGSIICNY